MKALLLLDHVLLWVARIYAGFTLGYLLYIARYFAWSDYRLIEIARRHHLALQWRGDFSIEAFNFSFLLIVAALWNLSLWCLRKDAGRLYLGLSSALMFLAFVWAMTDALVNLVNYPSMLNWQECLNDGSAMTGFFAMAWTALRAPRQPRIKLMPTIPSRQARSKTQKGSLPNFFMRLFRPPLHSVNSA